MQAENSRMDTLNPLIYLSEVLHWPKSVKLGFLTSSREVFQANWQGRKTPKSLKGPMWGVGPSLAPLGVGYCLIQAGVALAFS